MEPVFNIILEEIIKRKRTTIPMVILTGYLANMVVNII